MQNFTAWFAWYIQMKIPWQNIQNRMGYRFWWRIFTKNKKQKKMTMRATRRHLNPIMISQCFAILTQNYIIILFVARTTKWKTKYHKTAKNDFYGVHLTGWLNGKLYKIGDGTQKRGRISQLWLLKIVWMWRTLIPNVGDMSIHSSSFFIFIFLVSKFHFHGSWHATIKYVLCSDDFMNRLNLCNLGN